MERETAILIGAGFSYPSGIPLMKNLAQEFPAILHGEERAVYQSLKKLLPNITDDFEILLETCHDLRRAPVGLFMQLVKQRFGEDFTGFEEMVTGATVLYTRIKEYLRFRCQICRDKINYLYPLMTWLKRTGYRLDIFSLNYDLLIETLCEDFFIPYTDGFLVKWDPTLFFNPQYVVRLFKLHGSFIWYQSQLGERVKIPILDFAHSVEYLAQDKVVSMMLYPRRAKHEIFEELLRFFRERLLTLQKLVVIGYSFHDEQILAIVQDGLRKNVDLHLELVAPKAEELHLLFSGSKRVRCFEMGIEEWVEKQFSGELMG